MYHEESNVICIISWLTLVDTYDPLISEEFYTATSAIISLIDKKVVFSKSTCMGYHNVNSTKLALELTYTI